MAGTAQKQTPAKQFIYGGLSGMFATLFVQPIDLIKTRMQLSGEGGAKKAHTSSLNAFKNILREEGIVKMYKGLSAGLLRQATYTTTRLGVYNTLEGSLTSPGKPLPFLQKVGVAMLAGGVGALVGTPAEVALVRMTSDGRNPPELRRNYKNVFDALARIYREEGLAALWRGAGPTVNRAIILNAAQLSSYSQAKQMLMATGYFKDDIYTHAPASMFSGFLSTVVSIPIDMAKTRLQTMKNNEYKNAFDVLKTVVRKEGFFALWKGFTPYFFRLGPHTILTFLFLEQLNKWFGK